MDENESDGSSFRLIPKIINGGIAGVIGIICVFPLDLVKTRLQNQQIGLNGEKMYRNIMHCFFKTYRREGFMGMYRGCGVNALLITPEKSVNLVTNDYFRYKFRYADGHLPMFFQMLAGGLAGAFQIIVTTPMELLKIQMQDTGRLTAAGKPMIAQRQSAMELTIGVLKKRGFLGLYKGFGPTAMRDVIFSMVGFPLFASLNDFCLDRSLHEEGDSLYYCSLMAGMLSGSVTAFIVTPFDVIKTRIQAIDKPERESKFKNFGDCIKKTWRCEGPLAFFNGGLCRVLAIAPLFGIAQMVYQYGVAEQILGIVREHKNKAEIVKMDKD